jgi:amino acid transporter
MRPSNVKDCAMRWLFLVVSIASFSVAYVAKTTGMFGLAMLIGIIALVGAFLGFAQARIAATARPDAAMLSDKDIAALQSAVRNARKNPPAVPKA